ncbi:trafficking protein particle complex subunit 10-like [Dysidea avara]|uniref:trafficking protein particle complex subunit 10-like n=1 Tax=Dysidea avara TaxID=196820 RepID=UPI00332DFC5B
MRVASLMNVLGRGWLLAERALQVFHSTARETRALKFNYPKGTFEAWAYMTCMETVSAILSQVSQVTFEDMTSSLLLIRASLWEYGLKKLYKLGEICQLVPTSNAPDENQINRITSGITQQSAGGDSEDQGRLLVATLMSKQQFTSKYLELGEMVIGAFKHAGRKRTACSVGLDMAKFHVELGQIEEAERLLSDMCSLYSPENWTIFSANTISLLAE